MECLLVKMTVDLPPGLFRKINLQTKTKISLSVNSLILASELCIAIPPGIGGDRDSGEERECIGLWLLKTLHPNNPHSLKH